MYIRSGYLLFVGFNFLAQNIFRLRVCLKKEDILLNTENSMMIFFPKFFLSKEYTKFITTVLNIMFL